MRTKRTGIDPMKLRRPDMGHKVPTGGDVGVPSSRWLTSAALMLAIVMIGGFVAIWKTGAWTPVSATASNGAGAGNARAYSAALDSARVYSKRGEWGKAEAVLREISQQYPMEQEVRIALA